MAALSGVDTIREVAKRQKKTLLAFSTGKDAIAAWLAIREHFEEVVPYYLYLVPGLEFVDEQIAMYERFFETKITQLPHPSVHRLLNNFVFQPPQNCAVIEDAGLPNFDYPDIQAAMCQMHNGLIIQWVRINKTIGAMAGTYNFPIAFPNKCFGVAGGNQFTGGAHGSTIAVGVVSNATFNVTESGFSASGRGSAAQLFVIAIGY